jgi:flavin reductase (DIM6/NTAB) family NADH-FMN oxidoreductase RutF
VPVDREVFLAAMSNVAASVAAVTAYDPEKHPVGLTVSAFAAVSLDPQLVLACIDQNSNTLQPIRASGGLTLNLLSEGSAHVASALASKDQQKFDRIPYGMPESPKAGPVLVDDAFAYFECELADVMEAGDHVVAIGRVTSGRMIDDRKPLVYWRRGFMSLL